MSKSLIQRGVSLALAAFLTLAMLASVDQLAQPDEAAAQWAQQAPVPRG